MDYYLQKYIRNILKLSILVKYYYEGIITLISFKSKVLHQENLNTILC